ncbi:LTA synthase family protein [Porphyromonas sp. COT-239 OH1446]|uniref:LTA synthase family protein n=1 Tax=Porphyromonas sp. COT-239 OH1446 TaxID=1515613 RepID=UPI00068B832D|nr:sulfatase-like hydrolase/transferase [Porphyromonas sp. COT-239 OH1446]
MPYSSTPKAQSWLGQALATLSGSVYTLLAWRLALAFLMYTLCRVLFYFYNSDVLAIEGGAEMLRIFRGGLRFDAAGIFYVNLLVILLHILPIKQRSSKLYQSIITWIYWICNLPALVANIADIAYYRFTLRRTAMAVFSEFSNESPWQFVRFVFDYWPLTLVALILIVVWVYLYQRVNFIPRSIQRRPLLYYSVQSLLLLATAFLVVVGIRGFELVNGHPMNMSTATLYTAQPHQAAMVQNTPYSLIRTIGKPGLEEKHYFSDEEARALFDPVRRANPAAPYYGQFKGRNVVIIIWEGLSREWVGCLNPDLPDYKGYTPFLDSLITQAGAYAGMQGFAGGSVSMDAMPSILASLPKPGVSFVSSPYSNNTIGSIAIELKKEGYYSAFFHNAANGSMSFDALANQLGYDSYWGMDEYGNRADWDGNWGIWDEEFLQFMVRTMSRFREPFLATEFTISSHHPWLIPERYQNILPEGQIPMQRAIAYTDMALRRFFEAAKQQHWYDNTLFIITADHSVTGYLEEYKNTLGLFRVPIIFFDPSGWMSGGIDHETIMQQADIFPTLMGLMGINRPIISYGHNIFDPTSDHFAVSAIGGAYQLIWQGYALQYNGQEVKGLYHIAQDPRLKHNLKDKHPEIVKRLLPKLQAYIQDFSARMIHNRLTDINPPNN